MRKRGDEFELVRGQPAQEHKSFTHLLTAHRALSLGADVHSGQLEPRKLIEST